MRRSPVGSRSPSPGRARSASPAPERAARATPAGEQTRPNRHGANSSSASSKRLAQRTVGAKLVRGGGDRDGDSGAKLPTSQTPIEDVTPEIVAGLEDECEALKREKAELEANLHSLEASAQERAERLRAAEAECGDLDRSLNAVRADLAAFEARAANAAARRAQAAVMLSAERESILEEIDRLSTRCSQLERIYHGDLWSRIEECRNRQRRGVDEKQQLKGELLERQGERASIAAEKAAVERASSQQRVQVRSLEAQVTRLAASLEEEDANFERHRQAMQSVEIQLGKELEVGRRERKLAEHCLPSQVEAQRAETRRCENVAEDMQREATTMELKCSALRQQIARLSGEGEQHQRDLWRVEGARGAARAARRAVESELQGAEAEVARLEGMAHWIEEQNLQLARTQVPLRNSCCQLVEKGIQRALKEYMKQAYPVSEPPSPTRLPHHSAFAK